MKFIDVDTTLDAAAQRAARGIHNVELEDGDGGSALQAMCPWLAIELDATTGKLTMPVASSFEITIRYMLLQEHVLLAKPFYSMQIEDGPLARAWSLIAPKLGLLDMSVAGAAPLSRQQLRFKIEAVVAELNDADTAQLVMTVADFSNRIPAPALTAAPFNTWGDWLQLLTFGQLVPDTGELGPLCDLYAAAGDALSATAYAPGALTRTHPHLPARSRHARA